MPCSRTGTVGANRWCQALIIHYSILALNILPFTRRGGIPIYSCSTDEMC
jgi:hypothetical protein